MIYDSTIIAHYATQKSWMVAKEAPGATAYCEANLMRCHVQQQLTTRHCRYSNKIRFQRTKWDMNRFRKHG